MSRSLAQTKRIADSGNEIGFEPVKICQLALRARSLSTFTLRSKIEKLVIAKPA